MHYELIIVGGGVWGCSAALRVCERGVKSVLLIEANAGVAQEAVPRRAELSPIFCGTMRMWTG